MEKHNKFAVMLAALIHDIGKIRWEQANGVEASTSFYDDALSGQASALAVRDEVLNLLGGGENPVLDLVTRADGLEQDDASKVGGFKRKPLLSILSLIETEYERPQGLWYYKPGKIDPVNIEPLFANGIDDLPSAGEMNDISQAHYDNMVEEIRSLPQIALPQLIETLLFIFEKYLTSVSSDVYLSKPDISLFDHLKTTAALATCLTEAEDDNNPFLIVAADVSGIQSFIYSETNPVENSQKRRSKQFRGKSFYLTLLTDTFSAFLLRETGMPSANLLINGGGHFVIIVPNSELNRARIAEAKKKIQTWFYKTYKGELNLILETLEANDSLYRDFSTWYGLIATRLMAAKKQRSIEFIDEIFGIDLDAAEKQYSAIPSSDEKESYDRMQTYEKFLFSLTQMFSELGTVLPKAGYLIRQVTDKDPGTKFRSKSGLVEIPFTGFGFTWAIASDKNLVSEYLEQAKGNECVIYSVNNYELPIAVVPDNVTWQTAYGTRLIGNHAPIQQGEDSVMEFSDLAVLNATSEEKLSYSVLAVLRMDVDNLGSIFSFGLERQNDSESIRSLSRTVNLSRALNLFFTGHINTLAKKWQIYITYSGGDDLFVVGSWINVINFAFDLRKAFTKFACGNRNLTISAGVYLCRESYPVHKAANHAGEAETRAKNSSPAKDSISLFGREFRWERAEMLLDYGKEIDSLTGEESGSERITPAYIHYLLGQTIGMLNEKNELDLDKYFSNIFKIKYSLSRTTRGVNAEAIEKHKSGERRNKKVEVLSRLVNGTESTGLIADFVVPASYVILKNRKNK